MTISLGRTLPYDSSSLPGARGDRADPRVYATRFAPTWPCSRWGLPGRRVTTNAGSLLHYLFTLAPLSRSGLFSVALFRQVAPPRMLSGILLSGVRTFLGAITPHRGHLINLTR